MRIQSVVAFSSKYSAELLLGAGGPVLEYDGGLSREEADREALQEIIERLKRL